VQGLELLVVGGAQEGEGRDERSRADACDELELGPVAGLRPAVQQARAEGAVVAPAGDREIRAGRQRARLALALEVCALAFVRGEKVPLELRDVAGVAREVADPHRETHDACGGLLPDGNGGLSLRRRAARCDPERRRQCESGGAARKHFAPNDRMAVPPTPSLSEESPSLNLPPGSRPPWSPRKAS